MTDKHSPKVFLDANVLIEILESRPKDKQAIAVLTDSAHRTHISSLTCHIVTYVAMRRVGLRMVEDFLQDHIILDLLSEDVLWAIENRRNDDFEDALQVAVAIRTGCDTFYTFDAQLAKAYRDLPTIAMKLLR